MAVKDKSKRDSLIDIMKALMILVVVFYHLVYRKQGGFVDRSTRTVGYMCIPFFFMLSGYFYRVSDKPLPGLLGRRMKALLAPAVLITAAMLIILGPYYALVYGYNFKDWLADVTLTYLRPEFTAILFPDFGDGGQLFANLSPVWFVWTLAWASLLFYVMMRFTYDKANNMLLPICAVLVLVVVGALLYAYAPVLSWMLQLVPLYTGIMMIGAILGRYKVIERLGALPLLPSILIAIVTGVLHSLLFYYFGSDLMYMGVLGEKNFFTAIIFVIQIPLGAFSMMVVARLLKMIPLLGDALAWYGRNTMIILLLHAEIGGIAADIMHTYNKPGPNWYLDPLPAEVVVKSIVSFIVSLAGCALAIYIKEKLDGRKRLKKSR